MVPLYYYQVITPPPGGRRGGGLISPRSWERHPSTYPHSCSKHPGDHEARGGEAGSAFPHGSMSQTSSFAAKLYRGSGVPLTWLPRPGRAGQSSGPRAPLPSSPKGRFSRTPGPTPTPGFHLLVNS